MRSAQMQGGAAIAELFLQIASVRTWVLGGSVSFGSSVWLSDGLTLKFACRPRVV
jgi:hypothetical protein